LIKQLLINTKKIKKVHGYETWVRSKCKSAT